MKYFVILIAALLLASCDDRGDAIEKYMSLCHDKGGTITTEPHAWTQVATHRCYGSSFNELLPEFTR